ncbi:MAG: tRNA lysidine(34) synthetase TilS [Candidatus Nucleicultricaceae bacterium]
MDLTANKQDLILSFIDTSIRTHLTPFKEILTGHKPFAVAVSGGSDSLALVYAILKFYPTARAFMHTLTFDHQLRFGSGAEAAQVKKWMDGLGVDHTTLSWEGLKPTTDIMKRARIARYHALESWMQAHKVEHLFLAHHLDDVLETLCMRLLKKTGAEGLDALWQERKFGSMTYVRPFLGLQKKELQHFLKKEGAPWIEDPSNQNTTFARPLVRLILKNERLKKFLSEHQPKFIHFATLSRRLRKTLTDRLVCRHSYGYLSLDAEMIEKLPHALVLDLIRHLIQDFRRLDYPPKRSQVETLLKRIEKGGTLKGCDIQRYKGKILLMREWSHAQEVLLPVGKKGEVQWDGQFNITFRTNVDGCVIKALGLKGWQRVLAQTNGTLDLDIPFPVILTLPSLWNGDMLMEVPHLDDWMERSLRSRIIQRVQSIDS